MSAKVIIEQTGIRVVTIGVQGPEGPAGPQGVQGPPGQAIAPGGTTGQYLKKVSDLDNGTGWATIQEDDVANLTTHLAAKEPTVTGGTTSQYYRGDKTWQTLSKASVSLSNADNTSDANKPVSTATQVALDAKQAADNDLTAIAGLTPANDDVIQRKAGAWTNRTPAQLKSDLAVSKADVGLGNVPNADATNRSNHTGTQPATTISDFSAAADARITQQRGAANGLASLGADAKIPSSQLPAIAITDTFVVNSEAAMLALSANVGDVAVRTDINRSYVLSAADATTLANWQELLAPGQVLSVNGQTGAVSLSAPDLSAQWADSDLDALSDLTTTGLIVRSGDGTAATRTISASSSKLSVTNGDGISGNPTLDVVESNLTLNNLGGTVSIAKGGTGATGAATARANLGVDTTSNIAEGTNQYYTDAKVRSNRIDQLSAPTTDVAFNNQRITGLGSPSSNQDAATKVYVDSADSANATAIALKYTKPGGGIPQSDLAATTSAKINGAEQAANKGQANGYAPLDTTGKVPSANLPAVLVTSVAGRTGDVTIAESDISGLTVDLASAVHKTGTETVAGVKTFTSSPVVPSPTSGTDSANKSYVDTTAGKRTTYRTVGFSGADYVVSGSDHSSVIQSALDAGAGTVFFRRPPAGSTYIAQGLVWPANVSWLGEDLTTTIKLKDHATSPTLIKGANFASAAGSGDSWAGISYVSMKNLTLDGNQVNQDTPAVVSDWRDNNAVLKYYAHHIDLDIEIINAKEVGLYTEHDNDWNAENFNEYRFGESLIRKLSIKNYGLAGWVNRGSHDSHLGHVEISSYNAGGTNALYGYIQQTNGAAHYGSQGAVIDVLHVWGDHAQNAVYIDGGAILKGFIYAEGSVGAAIKIVNTSSCRFDAIVGYATAGIELFGASNSNVINAAVESNISGGLFQLDTGASGNTLTHVNGQPAGAIFDLTSGGTYSGNNNSFITNHPYGGTLFAGTVSSTDRVDARNDNYPTTSALTRWELPVRDKKFSLSSLSGTPLIDAGTMQVKNLSDPTLAQDAATKAYVDTAASSATVPDATSSVKGKVQLAGDLGGTAASPTVPGLAARAPLASPALTGTPTAPTQSAGDNSAKIATTAYADSAATAASATAVHITGAETIAGTKAFSSQTILGNGSQYGPNPVPSGGTVLSVVIGVSATLSVNATATVTGVAGYGPYLMVARPYSQRIVLVSTTAGSAVVTGNFTANDVGATVAGTAPVLTYTQGVNTTRLSLQGVQTSTGTGSAEFQLVPDANLDQSTLSNAIASQILLFGQVGQNYERFLLYTQGHNAIIGTSNRGTGVAMPIVFSTGGSVAGNVANQNALRILGDGSTEIMAGTFVMGTQIIRTTTLPQDTLINGVTAGVAASLTASATASITGNFWIQLGRTAGRVLSSISTTSGTASATGNFLSTDVLSTLSSSTAIAAAGTGYTVGDTLTVSGGNGGLFNVSTVDGSGGVTSIKINNSGTGYISATGVATTGGTGTGCTLNTATTGANIWALPTVSSVFTDSRTVSDATTTSGSKTLTSATAVFVSGDQYRSVTGDGIVTGTYIATYVNSTTVTLSDAATRTAGAATIKFGESWVLSDNLATTSDLPSGSHMTVDAFIVGSAGTNVKSRVTVTPGSPVVIPASGAAGGQLPDVGDVGQVIYSQKTWASGDVRLTDPGDTGISGLILDTRTTTPSGSSTTDKTRIFHRRGGTTKWITGLNVGFLNIDSYDFITSDNTVRLTLDPSGNLKNSGYLKVGSTTSNPSNTTAGDFTASRMNIGNLNFNDANGNVLSIAGAALTATSGTSIAHQWQPTLTPASNSTASFRVNNYQTIWNPATGVTQTGITNIYSDVRVRGDGLIGTIIGDYSQPFAVDSSSLATAQAATVYGYQTTLAVRPSGTTTSTITTGIGYDFAAIGSSIGLTATTIKGFNVNNPGSGNTITTLIGADIASLTRGATNIGLRIAAPSGGGTANYALQLSDTGGTAAGGLTFGTDTTLYRSAADTLKTDDSLTVGGSLTVSALSGVLKASAGTVSGSATTTDLTEGSNLYYTDVRVRANRLDQFAAPTSSVSLNSQKVTGVANGSAATDAAAFGQIPTAYSSTPAYDSATAPTAGSSSNWAKGDHAHPRYDWQPIDNGLITWAYDPAVIQQTSTPTAGTVSVIKLHVPVATSVTNILLFVGTGGTTLTSGQCFAGIYQNGTLLGSTADMSTTWNSSGTKTMAISGGAKAVAAGDVYVAFFANWTGGTAPTFGRQATVSTPNVGLASTAARFGTSDTGRTTSLAGTLGTISNTVSTAYWAGLS